MAVRANSPAGWPVLLALALGAFAIGTAEFSGMSMLPFYARELRVDQPTAAHAVSLYALGVVVGAPLFAILKRERDIWATGAPGCSAAARTGRGRRSA